MSVVLPIVNPMMIDCDSCTMKRVRCGDCVMSVLLEISTPDQRDLAEPTLSAISTLAESGLVPPLRFVKEQSA